MRKRLLCILLVAFMLISTVASGTMQVYAQSNLRTSDDLIELLKAFEGFSGACFKDNTQRSVGYGTRCDVCDPTAPGYPNNPCTAYTKDNPISYEHATELMRNHLTYFENKVNWFADKHGLTFTQNQFDALVSFTYNCGEGWMLESYDPEGNFRSAIANREQGDFLVYAFGLWSKSSNNISLGHIRRRMIEVDVYLNGSYADDISQWPDDFRYVLLDGNGGTIRYSYQTFYAMETCPIRAEVKAAPKDSQGNDLILDGWYTQPSGGVKVENLTGVLTNGQVLYAHWKNAAGETVTIDTDTSTSVDVKVIVPQWWPNVLYEGPGKFYSEVRRTTKDEQLHLTKILTAKDGTAWGYCADGWIPLNDTNYNSVVAPTGTWYQVTATDLNVRTGPGTGYALTGGQKQPGDQILVVETQKESGADRTWAKMSDGSWICIQNGDTAWAVIMDPQPVTKPQEVSGVTVSSVTITSVPTRKQYELNGLDILPDLTGGTIYIKYSNGQSRSCAITRSMVSGFDNTTEGTKTITVTCGGKTATFTIAVVKKVLESISITAAPNKTGYIVGEKLDTTGLKVMANYSDNTSTAVTDYTVTGYNSNAIGEQTITVTYQGMTATFKVNVATRLLESIGIAAAPNKTSYIAGEKLDTTGLKVVAKYSDNSSTEVTDYTVTGFNSNVTGEQTITVTYQGKTATFSVTVRAKVLTGISVQTRPQKLEYMQGSGALYVTGGVVQLIYDVGGNQTIPMTKEMVSGFNNMIPGTQTLTVSHKGFTTTFTVTIIKPTVTFLNYDGTVLSKVQYALGETVTPPEMPTKPDDVMGQYEFAGWDKEIVPCAGNTTYTATFKLAYPKGDLDRNNKVDENDAIYLLWHVFFQEEYPIYAWADFDQSGVVDENDGIYLLWHVFFPEEYPLN